MLTRDKKGWVFGAKFLWPDTLPVANQQESLVGPHPFTIYKDFRTGEAHHCLYVGSTD